MQPDDTKLSAASAFDSLKNYDNPDSQSVTFSGTINAGSSMVRTVTFNISRPEGAIADFLFNYSGSPNTAADWLFGPGPLRWGLLTLDGGWGDVSIKVQTNFTGSQFEFTLSADNNDGVDHNIVTDVTATIQPAFFIAPF